MTPAEAKVLANDMGRLAHDPLRWVLYAYRWNEPGGSLEGMSGPQAWQREHLDYVGRRLREDPHKPIRVAVSSGHGIGKSAIVGWYVNWGLSTFPNTRIVVTANTFPQLKTKTFPEINTWWQRSIVKDWFDCEGLRMWFSAQKGFEPTWRCDGVTWSISNTEAFAGLHNRRRRIIVIMDEASAIDDKIWEVTEGALTDSETEILWLAFGNPTRNTGRFRECFRKYRDTWQTFKVDSRTVDITNKELLREWEEQYGCDSDFFRVRVRGEFPDQAAGQLISSVLVEAAQARVYKEDVLVGAPKVFGVDIAREGGDSCSVWMRQGLYARRIYKTQRINTMQFSVKLAQLLDEHQPDACFMDMGNVGAGVYDNLTTWGHRNVFGVFFQEKPADGRVYLNKRIEMWAKMKEWLENGACLPREGQESQDIFEDLIGPEYFYNQRNLMQLEAKQDMKKRGLSSPDDGDALALTFAAPVMGVNAGGVARPASRGRVKANRDPF
ncbi:terminase [Cloacibacillus evryensis]|uniref:terminase n=1 Tax=Cloacibacillus evryensis TaxID=508460 RepID=UPI00241F32B3|nr:terminase [Cloacibacillus evryensis]